MAITPLRSLRVRGFRSISDLTLDLSSDVTLLVGANGSGKSNLVGAFELLGRIVDGQLTSHLLRSGGIGNLLHQGRTTVDAAEQIELEAWSEWNDDLSNGYAAAVYPVAGDSGAVSEVTYFHDRGRYPTPMDDHLGTHSESVLRSVGTARQRYALDVLSECRVFHFDDTSPDAPPKKRADVSDGLTLAHDARNLAVVLLDMFTNEPAAYERLVRTIRTVAPFFDNFVLTAQAGSILLRWREVGKDGAFSADALSDGTLRFICLATLFLQTRPPSTIVLDEPELGLHPFAIHQLAELMRTAGGGRKVVAATQSVTLLGQFTVDEVAVVERFADGTGLSRPDRVELEAWLEDYSLGELWEKNVLGGRPHPAFPVRA